MLQAIPYLSFNGNCEEAVGFYEQVLGARRKALVRFADAPPCPENPVPPDLGHLVMHACLELDGGTLLYAGDCPPQMPYEPIQGVSFTLNYDTVEQAQRVFEALSAGGKVLMPLQQTFWARTWGMANDRFGVPWMVNGEMLPDEASASQQ